VITNFRSLRPTRSTSRTEGGWDITAGTLNVGYLLGPSNPVYNSQPGMKLYRSIMAKYAPSANANDGNYFYGVAKAWNTVQILKATGKKRTRAGLMKAARSMNYGAG
jgi:hypothetical protein